MGHLPVQDVDEQVSLVACHCYLLYTSIMTLLAAICLVHACHCIHLQPRCSCSAALEKQPKYLRHLRVLSRLMLYKEQEIG